MREERERERERVDEHMAGIRQQRQGPRPIAADGLDDRERADQPERDAKSPARRVVAGPVGVIVVPRMPPVVRMAVGMVVPVGVGTVRPGVGGAVLGACHRGTLVVRAGAGNVAKKCNEDGQLSCNPRKS